MFDVLLESGRHGTSHRCAPGAAIALLVHVALGGAAVWATLHPKSAAQAASLPIVITWPSDRDRIAQPGPVAPIWSRAPGPVPPIIPITELPPVDGASTSDLQRWLRASLDASGGSPVGSDPSALWSVDRVEDAPMLLSAPPPVYPEFLRRAGVEGRVVVAAVVDTLGRAERPSVRVVESAHAGFEGPARDYVLCALFRPARVHGRAVRVLVRIPIDFKLRRGT
jgi:protein TonB